jgi:outer membrane protein OmpU
LKFEGKTMKKVLFATTALVATAGIAAADVTLTGSAEMGIAGGDTLTTGGTAPTADPAFFSSVDVRFTLSGETDNGLSFGAVIDLEDATEQSNNVDVTNGTADYNVFISGNFGTLTMGDTDGALDWALTEAGNVGNPGSIADDETVHGGYLGSYGDDVNTGQILRYDYSIGDFGFAVSVEGPRDNDVGYAVGFRYGLDFAGGTVNFGAGYQFTETQNGRWAPNGGLLRANDVASSGDGIDSATSGDNTRSIGLVPAGTEIEILGVSATAVLDNGLSVGLVYSDWDIQGAANDVTHVGIGAGYTFDAFSVHANYGVYDFGGGTEPSGYGLSAAYDLGGGASLHLGYGATDYDVPGLADESSYSFGLSMSF